VVHSVRWPVAGVLLGLGLAGCANPTSSEAQATAAFNRWNQMALTRDPGASLMLCTGVVTFDPAFEDRIESGHPGFPNPSKLSVSVAGNTAEIDFDDDKQQDVYVQLAKQSGKWRVCSAQTTAPGGFG
jgi:hypothetical protein